MKKIKLWLINSAALDTAKDNHFILGYFIAIYVLNLLILLPFFVALLLGILLYLAGNIYCREGRKHRDAILMTHQNKK